MFFEVSEGLGGSGGPPGASPGPALNVGRGEALRSVEGVVINTKLRMNKDPPTPTRSTRKPFRDRFAKSEICV